MGTSLKQKVILILQIVFALGILVWLWQIVGGQQVLLLLAQSEPGWLIAAFLVLTFQTLLSALRWRLTAKDLGIVLSIKTAFSEYYLAQLVNQALPGGIIGDAGRALRSRIPAGLVTSSHAVVFERLFGQVALFVLMAVALSMTFWIPNAVIWPDWISLTIAGLAVAVLFVVLTLGAVMRSSTGAIARGINSLFLGARKVFLSPSSTWSQIFLSLGTAICNVSGFVFAAWAVGSSLGFIVALVLVPMILLVMLLPLTVSGWGLREGAAVALFPLVGLAAAEGLAASVAFGLVSLAASLPGLFFIGSPRVRDSGGEGSLEKSI